MFQTVINKVFGTKHERDVKRMMPLVARIAELEAPLLSLDDATLQAKTAEFRQRLDKGETTTTLLPEAFAVCREASKRVMGMRHYDVQMLGGMVLDRGGISEMRTGEGKTLTATLPLYLNALTGKGAHLVTVNDYLARRDAEWMGRLYGWLGLRTGVIVPNLQDAQRREAYNSEITYGTNAEFGFDYLRDNMKFRLDDRTQRPLNFAIVDEVDSILIDEARTPLIISGQAELNVDVYVRINEVVARLKRDEDYVVDEEHRSVTLSDEGIEKVETRLACGNLFEPANLETLHHVIKSLEAHTLYKRDERYIVKEGKIVIIDDFTGRQMEGRRWSDGLHQAIEAKEGVRIQPESVTMATITYQNFYRMYAKLSGMTGTADTEAEEFEKIYKLKVTVIPTNKSMIRIDQPDLVYRTEREKFGAVIDQITECHKKGQPVLVGTISVDKSEVIAGILKKNNIPHNVLNAKYHQAEAEIISQAGRKGMVTIATNMAGRGTDILLGGNPEVMAKKVNPDETSDEFKAAFARFTDICRAEREEVRAAGGLFILGTERHDSRRIDNQLRGRAGRQGDPGESRFFLSLEDDLMKRFGADRIQGLLQRLGMEEGVPIEAGMVSRSIEGAQKRVEGRNFDVRKHLLEYDDVMDLQRKTIYGLRNRILAGEGMNDLVLDVLDESLSNLLGTYCGPEMKPDEWDLAAMCREMKDIYQIEIEPTELPRVRKELETQLWGTVEKALQERIAELEPIANELDTRNAGTPDYKPRTARELFVEDFARSTYLSELDKLWRSHLDEMRGLRESVSLQSYGQRDPKYIYKKAGFDLFAQFRAAINANVAKLLMRTVLKNHAALQSLAPVTRIAPGRLTGAPTGALPAAGATGANPAILNAEAARIALEQIRRLTQQQAAVPAGGSAPVAGPATEAAAPAVRRVLPKIGRNDPCWCGSGKKYKLCHMRAEGGGDGSESDAEETNT
jgi:preprotein translocase subunit SecA